MLHLARHGDLSVREDGCSFRIPTKKVDIASAIGVTTSHLSRILAVLEREHRIVRKNGWIVFNVVSDDLSIRNVGGGNA